MSEYPLSITGLHDEIAQLREQNAQLSEALARMKNLGVKSAMGAIVVCEERAELRQQNAKLQATIDRIQQFRDRPYREGAGMTREQYRACTEMLDVALSGGGLGSDAS